MPNSLRSKVGNTLNIKLPRFERHLRAWNKIDFGTKIGPVKIITTDRGI
jgi:hypothetical protein